MRRQDMARGLHDAKLVLHAAQVVRERLTGDDQMRAFSHEGQRSGAPSSEIFADRN